MLSGLLNWHMDGGVGIIVIMILLGRARCAAAPDQPAPSPSRPVPQSFVQCTQRLTEATGLVMQTVSAQHAAYCELLIGGPQKGAEAFRRGWKASLGV